MTVFKEKEIKLMGIKGVNNKIKSNSFDDSEKFWSNNVSAYYMKKSDGKKGIFWSLKNFANRLYNKKKHNKFYLFYLHSFFIFYYIDLCLICINKKDKKKIILLKIFR